MGSPELTQGARLLPQLAIVPLELLLQELGGPLSLLAAAGDAALDEEGGQRVYDLRRADWFLICEGQLVDERSVSAPPPRGRAYLDAPSDPANQLEPGRLVARGGVKLLPVEDLGEVLPGQDSAHHRVDVCDRVLADGGADEVLRDLLAGDEDGGPSDVQRFPEPNRDCCTREAQDQGDHHPWPAAPQDSYRVPKEGRDLERLFVPVDAMLPEFVTLEAVFAGTHGCLAERGSSAFVESEALSSLP
jgi:hypothetical protein